MLKHILIAGSVTGLLAVIFPEYWLTALVIFLTSVTLEGLARLINYFMGYTNED